MNFTLNHTNLNYTNLISYGFLLHRSQSVLLKFLCSVKLLNTYLQRFAYCVQEV